MWIPGASPGLGKVEQMSSTAGRAPGAVVSGLVRVTVTSGNSAAISAMFDPSTNITRPDFSARLVSPISAGLTAVRLGANTT